MNTLGKVEFEKFCQDHGFNVEPTSDGSYANQEVHHMWAAWTTSRKCVGVNLANAGKIDWFKLLDRE